MITTNTLLKYFKNRSEIARCLGITTQAVHQWPLDGPIPEMQEMRLKYELRPDIFEAESAQQEA